MKMRPSEIVALVIILLSVAMGIYFYPQMPEPVASHWNAQGQVDGYMSKFWGLFLMPIISVGMLLLFILIPRIDPLKANIEKFRKYFDGFVVLILLFFFYLYILTIQWNVGHRFNMGRLMCPALAILFFYCGVLIEKAKRNWFVGIRTPWTLSSETVWEKTHKIGGKLFKVAGVIALLGVFFQKHTLFFILIPAIAIVVFSFIYSYVAYKKEGN